MSMVNASSSEDIRAKETSDNRMEGTKKKQCLPFEFNVRSSLDKG